MYIEREINIIIFEVPVKAFKRPALGIRFRSLVTENNIINKIM